MSSFIKLAALGVALILPISTEYYPTTQQPSYAMSMDYEKYDDLVKDFPSAQRLIDFNKKLDNLNVKLIQLEKLENQ